MKIVSITETGTEKTFEVCLVDKCSKDEAHKAEHHRTWTWAQTDDMTEEDMIREVKLLAAAERARLAPPQPNVRTVSIRI